MPNINILKALINMCLIGLILLSQGTSSLTSITHYSYKIIGTNNILNIYVIEKYNSSPLKINIKFNLTYISIDIYNDSHLNIKYYNNSTIFSPIISYSPTLNLTTIKVSYLFASNMSITVCTLTQIVKIIGNVSYSNISLGLSNTFSSTTEDRNIFNYSYITYILILISSVIIFISLKRYKGK